jgi:predicted DNA-binding transcriptional regulator AlpA
MIGKLQDHIAYPPRGLRVERAAAYVGVSKTVFLEMVAEGTMPPPKRLRGHDVAVWDRVQLDSAFDDLDNKSENTVMKLLNSGDEGAR